MSLRRGLITEKLNGNLGQIFQIWWPKRILNNEFLRLANQEDNKNQK